MGVWIEINAVKSLSIDSNVTPYVGVWIEISGSSGVLTLRGSPPMWGCGLKSNYGNYWRKEDIVTPYVGVWIEIFRWHLLAAYG